MNAMTERILNLTLEIIYLLTGEDYIVVRKCDHDSRGRTKDRPPNPPAPGLGPRPLPLDRHEQILQINSKIIELLSAEVSGAGNCGTLPRRMSEDAMTDSQQPIRSEGGVSEMSSVLIGGGVSGPQDCTGGEDRATTRDYQVGGDGSEHDPDHPGSEEISAVLSVSCTESPPNRCLVSPPPDCITTCPVFEAYPTHRPSSPLPSLPEKRTAAQDEDWPSERPCSVSESVTDRLRAQYSYIPPSKRRKGNPVPLRKKADSPGPAPSSQTDLAEDLGVETNLEDVPQTAYQCSQCRECLSNAADYITHQALHKAQSWFPTLYHPTSLFSVDFCAKQKPFVCLDCGKCFMYRSAFTRHQRVHTGERPFVCSECGKSFSQNTHLAKHRRNHKSSA